MANNEHINKVIYGNDTLIDLTSDTVTQADVLNSKSFHDASGTLRTGTADISGKADLTDLADAFSESTAYSTGDYVTYSGDLYRFTYNKSAGAWDSTKATQITVADELSVLPSKADKIQLAPAFSTSSSYSAGSYCTFNGKLYRFDSNKSAGDWSYSKVTEVTVGSELRQKENWTSFSSGDFLVVDLAVEHQLPQHNVSLIRADSVSEGGDGVVSADQVTVALNKTANPEMIAPTFSSSQAYLAGDYVTKLDGVVGAKVKLFQFTANHTGSWTGLDVREVEVTTVLNTKVDKVSGKGLSTNDYDNTAKGIVDNIQNNVKANTQLISESIWGENGKNLLKPNREVGYTQEINGVTYIVNDDYSITGDGTASAGANLSNVSSVYLQAGEEYILSGGENLQFYYKPNYTKLNINASVPRRFIAPETGEYQAYFLCSNGTTLDNVTIYPMLRKANILDPTYEPYHPSVKDSMFPREEQRVLGAKNLLKNEGVRKVADGITYTINADGTITADGTATADVLLGIKRHFDGKDFNGMILSGCPAGGGISTYDMYMCMEQSPYTHYADDHGNGAYVNCPTTVDCQIVIRIRNGQTVNNLVFKPMLSFDGGEFVPYAMTNKELTDVVKEKIVNVTAGENVTVNANTSVRCKSNIVAGSIRLEIGTTLSASAIIATIDVKPKSTVYAVAVENNGGASMPVVIGANGNIQLFGAYIPTSGNHLIIPVSYVV